MKTDAVPERVNYHTHCRRCRHAAGSVADYAEEAVRQGLVRLGFSDHLPFPGDRLGMRMDYAELGEYLAEVAAQKEAAAGKLTVFAGFEGEFFEEFRDYYETLLARPDCDYLILGQHYFYEASGRLANVFCLSGTEQYERYAASVVEAMRSGYFRYVAHPDLMFLNELPWDDHCERACDVIIDGAVKYGVPLEYNANGLRRKWKAYPDGERYPYPHAAFWKKAAAAHVEVYVGSDCHEPGQVWDDKVAKAYEDLRGYGIVPRTDW